MIRKHGQRRSTTLIEVVAALTILAIALPPMITAFADASIQTIYPSHAAVAAFLSVEKMEEVVARRYRGTDGYNAVTVANFPAESPISGFPLFSRSVTVDCVNSTLASVSCGPPDPGYKKVTVTVTWDSGAQRTTVEHVFADF